MTTPLPRPISVLSRHDDLPTTSLGWVKMDRLVIIELDMLLKINAN